MHKPEYLPYDQRKHLGPPPWEDSPELQAWEKAHNHDVRVKCIPEYGCVAVDHEAEYQRWLLWQFVDAQKMMFTGEKGVGRVMLNVPLTLVDAAAEVIGYDEQGQ